MRIVESFTLTPGQDYFTGSNQLPVIDTGIDVDDAAVWGRIYVGEDTVGTMAAMFGWIPPNVAQAMTERVAELEASHEAQAVRIAELETALDAMTAVKVDA